MWRIVSHGTFGGTWLSDYILNRLGLDNADRTLLAAEPDIATAEDAPPIVAFGERPKLWARQCSINEKAFGSAALNTHPLLIEDFVTQARKLYGEVNADRFAWSNISHQYLCNPFTYDKEKYGKHRSRQCILSKDVKVNRWR